MTTSPTFLLTAALLLAGLFLLASGSAKDATDQLPEGCRSVPKENTGNGYPEANLRHVRENTDSFAQRYAATQGRYCVDTRGNINYFLFFDRASEGFHGLEVCSSIFTSFEGDFERAWLVYSDKLKRCG